MMKQFNVYMFPYFYFDLESHIMMSYNHQSKVEVFKMKTRLQSLGYKVWIDEEQITAGGHAYQQVNFYREIHLALFHCTF